MTLRFPESMDECFYFTNRAKSDGTYIKAWVFKAPCPKCNKLMGRPLNPKTGKVMKKSEIYVCDCGYEVSCEEMDPTLKVNVQYKCECGHEGEATTEYKRKTWKGVKAYVFECDDCGAKIGITKKMKEPKKKKA